MTNDHSSHRHPHAPQPAPRAFSLARQGIGFRLAIAGLLVVLIWAALYLLLWQAS